MIDYISQIYDIEINFNISKQFSIELTANVRNYISKDISLDFEISRKKDIPITFTILEYGYTESFRRNYIYPKIKVLIDKKDITDYITSLNCQFNRNMVNTFSMEILKNDDLQSDLFTTTKEVEIYTGESDYGLKKVMTGILDYPTSSDDPTSSIFKVSGRDKGKILADRNFSGEFKNPTAISLIRHIFTSNGFDFYNNGATNFRLPALLTIEDEKCWEVIKKISEVYDYSFGIDAYGRGYVDDPVYRKWIKKFAFDYNDEQNIEKMDVSIKSALTPNCIRIVGSKYGDVIPQGGVPFGDPNFIYERMGGGFTGNFVYAYQEGYYPNRLTLHPMSIGTVGVFPRVFFRCDFSEDRIFFQFIPEIVNDTNEKIKDDWQKRIPPVRPSTLAVIFWDEFQPYEFPHTFSIEVSTTELRDFFDAKTFTNPDGTYKSEAEGKNIGLIVQFGGFFTVTSDTLRTRMGEKNKYKYGYWLHFLPTLKFISRLDDEKKRGLNIKIVFRTTGVKVTPKGTEIKRARKIEMTDQISVVVKDQFLVRKYGEIWAPEFSSPYICTLATAVECGKRKLMKYNL